MQGELHIYTAEDQGNSAKSKRIKMVYVALFLLSLILVIIAIKNGNKLQLFIYTLLSVSYGISLLPSAKKKNLLEINNLGFTLTLANTQNHLSWHAVKMAKYDGRFLNLFWGSSFCHSIDLHLFSANDHLAILSLFQKNLEAINITISEKKSVEKAGATNVLSY